MKDYLYIRAWGKLLGSSQAYIHGQVATARTENAPEDSLFKHTDGLWYRFAVLDVSNENKQLVAQFVEEFRK